MTEFPLDVVVAAVVLVTPSLPLVAVVALSVVGSMPVVVEVLASAVVVLSVLSTPIVLFSLLVVTSKLSVVFTSGAGVTVMNVQVQLINYTPCNHIIVIIVVVVTM